MNEIDMLCFQDETEETGPCTRPYWRSGISSTRERNSASFHSFRYAPLVKRRNFSHSCKKFQIFNRDSCKNLLVYLFFTMEWLCQLILHCGMSMSIYFTLWKDYVYGMTMSINLTLYMTLSINFTLHMTTVNREILVMALFWLLNTKFQN